ncbi:hypothetical protein Cni_G15745 [Canna indica]|uniref:Dof zinc finger protein n=1 Tax=Canna indica TaxID=4628 RepID=A0AAQ3KGM4_9LILI|nr:hypothetical protein Cni_G15745 [Canna indica]
MDTQWPQGMGLVKPMEGFASSMTTAAASPTTSGNAGAARPPVTERRPRPSKEHTLNCPRCNSTNTKFCYYNNYSLTQPRYFCKTCRRYWTEGGSLRNVPVGGGSRKNKRTSSLSSSTAAGATTTTTTTAAVATAPVPKKLHADLIPPYISLSSSSSRVLHEGQDLNLAFHQHGYGADIPSLESGGNAAFGSLSAMELLKGRMSARGLGSFMPLLQPPPLPDYITTGFGSIEEFRPPTLNFPIDGTGAGYGSLSGVDQESAAAAGGSKLLFPFEDLKPVAAPNNEQLEQNKGQVGADPPGFWSGIIGGGSW